MLKSNNRIIHEVKRCFSSIKKHIDHSRVPVLKDEDIVEQNIRGSGPGGSKISKTSNCVLLKHIPTGIVVKCQETRYLEQNRKRAMELLIKKLDNFINGDDSVAAQTKRLVQKRNKDKNQRREKLQILKEKWKERENSS